jgi:hypothetical protein
MLKICICLQESNSTTTVKMITSTDGGCFTSVHSVAAVLLAALLAFFIPALFA